MEFGLLLLRVVIGALFVGHGTQKLFGWFNGPGIDGASGMFGGLGYRKPRTMAILAGATEAGAGVLLILGLLTPFAAAAIIGVMLNAIVAVHLPNGPWVSNGGYEYNLVLITAATALTFTGPGALAIDTALPWSVTGPMWGVIALVVGLVAGAAILSMRETSGSGEADTADESVQSREHERV